MGYMLIIFLLSCLFIVFIFVIIYYLEWKDFNNGTCPKCNTKLKFEMKVQRYTRIYYCNKCDYDTWVCFNTIDEKFRKENGLE